MKFIHLLIQSVICCEFLNIIMKYINEIALRVHNTYHISIDCCNISQFELHYVVY